MLHNSIISIIAAIGKNRELGKDNKLLWHIPEDLKRFKELTLGHPIIMGRKTFESIGRVLPGRTNIIVTRDKGKVISSLARRPLARLEEVLIVDSLEEALRLASLAQGNDECFVIGGGQIFQQALQLADKLYLTIIDAEFEADTFFPDYSGFKKVLFREEGESNGLSYTFLDLTRP